MKQIKITLANSPGYPTKNPNYLGTIHHTKHGVAASINSDYNSTFPVRRYVCGLEPPNYPVPSTIATLQTDKATYIGDSRVRADWMPLFRGFTWQEWTSNGLWWEWEAHGK